MFKKLAASVLVLSLMIPTIAQADGMNHRNHVQNRHHHHHHHNHHWVAPLVGGLVLGGIIANQGRSYYYAPPPPVYYEPQPRYDYYTPRQCVERWITEYDNWGNRYQTLVRECF